MGDQLGFFERYNSFEKRVQAAIEADDVKLVQILLGHKYCQLWQLWLVHGIVTTKIINMEIIVNSKLFLNIIKKQITILADQKEILKNHKSQLERHELSDTKKMFETRRDLVKNLMTTIRDSAVECRDMLQEEMNRVTDYRPFYIPEKLLGNLDIINSEDLGCIIQQVSTISSAERLVLNKEIDNLIDEISKNLESQLWEASDVSTKTSYHLGEFAKVLESFFNNEIGEVLNKIVSSAAISNMVVGGRVFPVGAITVGIINLLRYVPPALLKLQENYCEDMYSASCITKKLEEINRYCYLLHAKLSEIQISNQQLHQLYNKVNNNIFDKLNDGKFINKQLVKDMYISLLYNYLELAKCNKSNLLYNDINKEGGNIKVIVQKILEEIELVSYEMFFDLLHKELRKDNPNYDIISVFIINSTPILSYKCLDQNANQNLNRIMKKSYHTIMIDVNNLLFNFGNNSDDDVMLVSHLPNMDGTYTRSCKNSIVLDGNGKQQDLILKVRKFADQIEHLIEIGGLNRIKGFLGFPAIVYIFCDFFKQLFNNKSSNSIKDQNIVHDRVREFYVKISHSVAVENEGMIKEYIEDIKERLKCEKNSDVCELYKIIIGKNWRNIFVKSYKWKETPYEQSLEQFMKITSKRVNAFKILEEKSKANLIEEKARDSILECQREKERITKISDLHCSFGKMIFNSNMDQDIRSLMFEEQDQIVSSVACFIMTFDCTTPPEKILQDVLLRLKRRCYLKNIFPEFMFEVVCMGNSFFDAVSISIKQIRPDDEISVDSLLDICKTFAAREMCNRKSWFKEILGKNNQDLSNYIARINLRSQENVTSDSRSTIEGRPNVEGI